MALTPNPLRNATSGQGDISGMKMLQDFPSVSPNIMSSNGPGDLGLGKQVYALVLIPNSAGNAGAIANMLGNANIVAPPGTTWFLVSIGFHVIWVSNAQGIPAAGPVPGTTLFERVYFDGNDLYSAGDFTNATSGVNF